MSWEPLAPSLRAPRVPGLALTLWRGNGRYRARLVLRIADAELLRLPWIARDAPVRVAVGRAEHAGQIRLTPGTPSCARLRAATGRTRTVLALALPLEVFPGLRGGKEKLRAALEFDFDDGWIEATLPPWGDPSAGAPPVRAAAGTGARAPFTGVMAGPGPHAGVRRGSPVL